MRLPVCGRWLTSGRGWLPVCVRVYRDIRLDTKLNKYIWSQVGRTVVVGLGLYCM